MNRTEYFKIADSTRELSYETSKLVKELTPIMAKSVNYIGGAFDPSNPSVVVADVKTRLTTIIGLFTTFLTAIDKDAAFDTDAAITGKRRFTLGSGFGYADPIDTAVIKKALSSIETSIGVKLDAIAEVTKKSPATVVKASYQKLFASLHYDIVNALVTRDNINRSILPYIEMFAATLKESSALTADEFIAPFVTLFTGLKTELAKMDESKIDQYNWVGSDNIDYINGLDVDLLLSQINGTILTTAKKVAGEDLTRSTKVAADEATTEVAEPVSITAEEIIENAEEE